MQGHMVSLVTLDFVLRNVGARMMGVALVGHIRLVHFDNRAADMTRFRVPRYVITDLELFWVMDLASCVGSFDFWRAIFAELDIPPPNEAGKRI
jgi:hypothetical protein